MASTTRSAPGISVPITMPYEASLSTAVAPRADASTAVQNTTMITAAMYMPLCASDGATTYASVLATYASTAG